MTSRSSVVCSVEGMDQVDHVVTVLVKPFVRLEARFPIRSEGAPIFRVGSQANAACSFGPQSLQEHTERLRPDASTDDIGLADKYVHINEVGRQGRESRCSQLLRLKVLPTHVSDRLSVKGNQSMTVRAVLADFCQHLARVTPPTSDVRLIEPGAKQGRVLTGVEWEKPNCCALSLD